MAENTVKDNRTSSSANSEFNAISLMIENYLLGKVHTADVVIVTGVEASGSSGAAGYVTVKPLVKQVSAKGDGLEPVENFKIPYMRIQGGIAALVIDPEPGDIGICVYTKADSSNVEQEQGEAVLPGSFRTFDQADGFYIGGFLNKAPEIFLEMDQDRNATLTAPESVTINTKSCAINADEDCTVNCQTFTVNASQSAGINAPSWSFNTLDGSGVSNATIRANINQEGSWSQTSGNMTTTGDTTAGSVSLRQHVHSGVDRGSGNTDSPVGR